MFCSILIPGGVRFGPCPQLVPFCFDTTKNGASVAEGTFEVRRGAYKGCTPNFWLWGPYCTLPAKTSFRSSILHSFGIFCLKTAILLISQTCSKKDQTLDYFLKNAFWRFCLLEYVRLFACVGISTSSEAKFHYEYEFRLKKGTSL